MSNSLCAYCGRSPAPERDHVVAKGFFFPPLPPRLITVPSCAECNRGFSKDEEYVRMMLVSGSGAVESHVDAGKLLLGPVKRSFDRSRGLRSLMLGSLTDVKAYTNEGKYLGVVTGMNLDVPRFRTVVEKIVRGMFYDCEDHPLPRDHKVIPAIGVDDEFLEHPTARLIAGGVLIRLGDGVFTYSSKMVEGERALFGFVMCFYDTFYCAGAAVPAALVPEALAHGANGLWAG